MINTLDFWLQSSIRFEEDLSRQMKQPSTIKERINIERKMRRGCEKILLEKMENEETERMISLISDNLNQEEDPNFSKWKVDHDHLLEYYATKDLKEENILNAVQKYYCSSETLEYKLYEYIAFYFRDVLKTLDFPEKLFNISLWIERQYVTIELDHEQIETYFKEIVE